MNRFSIQVLLISLTACTAEHSEPAVQAASSSTASVMLPTQLSGDSTDSFKFPQGYYLPDSSIDYHDVHLEMFELQEHGYPNTVSHRYPAQVYTSSGSDTTVTPCDTPLIRVDTLEVQCRATPLGTVVVRGSFTDLVRPGWDTVAVDISQRVVANVTITIEKDGKVVLSRRTGLVYWEGE